MSNNQPVSPHRAQNLNEEQLAGLLQRVNKTLDELDGLMVEEQRLTHATHPNPLLCQTQQELTGFHLYLSSSLHRVRILGR